MLPARAPYLDDGGGNFGGGSYHPTGPPGGPFGWPEYPGGQTGGPSFAESRAGGRETDKRTPQSRRPPPSWQAPKDGQPRPKYDDEYGGGDAAYRAACAAAHEGIKDAMKKAALAYGHEAANQAGNWAKSAAIHFYSHVEDSSWTVKGIALICGLALLCVEMLEIINPFKIVFEPLNYLLGVYNVCWAIIIIIMEGPTEMQCASCGTWQRLQKRLFGWAAFLASRTGRALFYFFVGSLNLCNLPTSWLWSMIQLVIAGALCFVGMLSFFDRYGCTGICCPTMHGHVGPMNNLADPHDYSQASESDSDDEESRYESHRHHDRHHHRHRQNQDERRSDKIQDMEALMSDLPRGGPPMY